jgi:CubicO group peptidase (beta-lactamase class C family)
MMAHQARLKPWIPFYLSVTAEGKLDPEVFQAVISEDYPVRVAEDLYIHKGYDRVIMDSIIHSKLLKTSDYKYSDLGYYFLKEIIENVTNKDLDEYVKHEFYSPLGLSTTCYLPRKHFPLERIVPTEKDNVFRHQLLHGDVHDQGAAMLGGVSGHAGLFSNANDLGIFLQMLLNEGKYGNKQYFTHETIDEFTQLQSPLNENRRGIGFDKPLIEYEEDGPTCEGASKLSFGHSGFTGTYLWADPANGLVYIFLSNRVHPDADNNRISELNIRTKIHQYFYDAIKKSEIFAPQKD